jgi:hypothetical protein
LNNLRSIDGGICPARAVQKKNVNNRRNLLNELEELDVPSGQVQFDERGHALWETGRNRRLEHPELKLADEQPPRNTLKTNGGGLKSGYNPYDSGMLPKPSYRRKKDLRALSRWITQSKITPDKQED